MRFLFIILNLLGFPGLGTFLSGRHKTGLAQLALSGLGFALTLIGVSLYASTIFSSGRNYSELFQAAYDQELMSLTDMFSFLAVSLLGLTLFTVSWIWAACTPQTKRTPPPLPPAPL
ncbi:MAG: hypothetical protein SH807_07135 [Blastochloris sp.]|jgi:TM2 domain-containing membrane protein YozV|nr:hypothetical protein [Blastochloris sp.]